MKNYWKFMLAALAIAAVVSCAKEEMEDPDAQNGIENPAPDQGTNEEGQLVPMTITVTGENAMGSNGANESAAEPGLRTDVADDNESVIWCENDAIALYDASGVREFTIKEGSISDDGRTAVFEGMVDVETTDIYAVYPFDAAVSCTDGKIVATTMSEQTVESGKVADGAIVSVAKGKKGEALQFKNVVGVFRLDVNYEDVTEIYLDGAALAGTATFDAATGEMEADSATETSDFVTLLPAGETFEKGSYFIPLLPGTTPKGDFHISMVRKENKGAVHIANDEVTVPRSSGFFVDDTNLTESFIIKDAATLQTFLTNAKNYDAAHVATVIRDIDLTGVTITPATTYAGTFNGGNHSLKNWSTTSAKPLFTATATGAVVKDFVLDASCTFTMAETDNKQAYVVATNAGTVSGVTNKASIDYTRATDKPMQSRYFGTIVGYSTGLVSDCHNEGNITIDIPNLDYTETSGNEYQHQRVGGVVGSFAVGSGKVGVTGCTNSGNITYNFKGTSTDAFKPHFAIGGVCGMLAAGGTPKKSSEATNQGTIENCTNSGQIKLYEEKILGSNYSNVGGVIGYLEGTITGCVNTETGKVTLELKNDKDGTKVSAPSVGGVAGTVLKGDVLNCSNAAPVYMTGYIQGGKNDAAYSGGTEIPAIGGVVAKAGAIAEDTTLKIQDCMNSGEVSGTVWNSNNIRMGGIVGWTSIPVVGSGANTLKNSGDVALNTSTTFKTAYIGGVIGHSISTFNKIYNTGDVTVVNSSTSTAQKGYIGGVAGYMSKVAENTFKQGNNNGAINVSGGKADPDGKEEYMIGGVVGNSGATKVTSNGTGWADCNTNYGDITVNSPVKVYVGGILGRIGAKNSGTGDTARCKNRGNITVKNPASGSCVGGIIGEHGRGKLGDANNVGASNDLVTISVETTLADVYVGGYVGRVETNNGPDYPSCSTTISGFGFYGNVNAPNATAALIAGNVTFTGTTTTNGLMIASSGQPIRIAKANQLNRVPAGDLTAEGACLEKFIATITPSSTTTKTKGEGGPSLKNVYYIRANGDTKTEASFPYGFINY